MYTNNEILLKLMAYFQNLPFSWIHTAIERGKYRLPQIKVIPEDYDNQIFNTDYNREVLELVRQFKTDLPRYTRPELISVSEVLNEVSKNYKQARKIIDKHLPNGFAYDTETNTKNNPKFKTLAFLKDLSEVLNMANIAIDFLNDYAGGEFLNNTRIAENTYLFIHYHLEKIRTMQKAIGLCMSTARNVQIHTNIEPEVIPNAQPETKTDKIKTKIEESNTEQETIEYKPTFKPEFVQTVFDIIKDFFSPEQQNELKHILETGSHAKQKLHFRDNGNRLTDTFRKLIEHDIIIGCQKIDLIRWIISNFKFTKGNTLSDYIFDTVEKTISRNHYPCKNPIINIENGQITKNTKPRTKKHK